LSYFANYDAIKWFIEEAFPIIRAHVPEARLVVTGDPGNRRLPVQENVHLTGYLEDVKPVLGSAAVSLAPIRLGGGTRLKVLESMALRVPVVATTLGAQGLDVVDGEHLLMEDTAAGFANAVVKLLKDPGHGQKLAENAYRLVGERYEWSVVLPRFLDVVEEAAQGRGSLTQGR
jgi:glycosyltransferase involved in cell wall biosynthesis